MDESQSIMLSEKSYVEKNKKHIISFVQHSGKVKTNQKKIRGVVVGTRSGRRVLITKKQQATFSGGANIIYLSSGGDYTAVYLCQNS